MSVFDAKQFLGELGFSEAEVSEIAPRFEGERGTKLANSVRRQADYSREMDALDRQRAELAAKEAQLTAEAAEWANLTASEKAASQGLRAQLEQTQGEALRLRQTIERVAQEAGVDPKTLIGDAPTVPATTPAPSAPTTPAFDASKYASADAIAQVAQLAVEMPAQIMAIASEHRRLTGQELNPTTLVAELKRRASTRGNTKPLDLTAIWEEQHNIADVRAQAEAARIKAIEDAAYNRGRESAMTESALPPGAQPSGKHAVVFNSGRQSALQRPQPGSGLQSAINALATRKYHQTQPTGAAPAGKTT